MKKELYINKVIAGSLFAVTITIGTILSSIHSNAGTKIVDPVPIIDLVGPVPITDVVDSVSITVPVACSMSGIGMESHNAEIVNGTYTPDIGSTTLHAFCNDNEGFAIYAAGYTGNEVGGTNSNKLVGTTASNNAAIESGIATTAGNPDVSNWAMKLTMTQDSGDTSTDNAFTIDSAPNVALPSTAESGVTQAPFSNYHVVPNEYVKVAHKNFVTDMTATTGGVKLTTTYAAYISKTQPADTYSGQVKYTLVHPASADTPVEPVSIEDAYSKAGKTKLNGYYKMQDMNSTICSAVTLEDDASETILIDARDNKIYTVSKLRDGNCWMTQNLDHDIKTDGSVIYNNTTTDLGWNGTSYATASWSPASATKVTSDATWTTGSAGYTIPESYDPGELYWNGELWPQNQSDCEAVGGSWDDDDYWCYNPDLTSSAGDSHYHIGNFYNWTAAVAMNDSSSYTTQYTDVNQSICPAGWTLPKSGNNTSNGSFQYLFEQYGWDSDSYMMENPNIWNTAIKLPLSGDWYGGSLDDVGRYDTLWSPVVVSSDTAYTAIAYSDGDVSPDSGGARDNGHSLRCIAR